MNLRTVLAGVVLAGVLASPAQAAAPWSDQAAISGSTGGTPQVLDGVIAFNGSGSFPGVPLLRSVIGPSGPQAATRWDNNGIDFDSQFGAFAVGDEILYAGSNGHRRVQIAVAKSPASHWRGFLRGPKTGGARTAAAPGAAVFSTFEAGSVGRVYLVRESDGEVGPSIRLSDRGHIRAVAVATNARGDVRVAWDLRGVIQTRLWSAKRKKLGAVQNLGEVSAASSLSVALGNDGRSIVAWVDQQVNEGSTGIHARFVAMARTATRGFTPKILDTYPDLNVVSGRGIEAAYLTDGRGVIAWSGHDAVRAAFVNGRSVGAAQDLAPVTPTDGNLQLSFGDLAVGPGGDAVVTLNTPIDDLHAQVLAVPLAGGATAFGPVEQVSPVGGFLGRSSARFIDGRVWVAWADPGVRAVEVAQRPAP
jgi:hypothetical protein